MKTILQIVIVLSGLLLFLFAVFFTISGWMLYYNSANDLAAIIHAVQYCTGLLLGAMGLVLVALGLLPLRIKP